MRLDEICLKSAIKAWENEATPESASTLIRGLTRLSDSAGRGLAVKATHVCAVDGCDRPHLARGWCGTHYKRWQQHGTVADPPKRVVNPRPPCSVDGCGRPSAARGWCGAHYQRWRNNGDLGEAARRRPEFGQSPTCHPDRPLKARGLCNPCYQRSQFKDHRTVNLKHFYKMTREDEARMLAAQGGACGACGDPFTATPRVDHDHRCCPEKGRSCGKCVRGLLCAACNSAAGYLRDDPDRALAMAAYLLQGRDVLVLSAPGVGGLT